MPIYVSKSHKIEDEIDYNMLLVMDAIIANGDAKHAADFCSNIGLHAQAIPGIKKGERHFSLRSVKNTCDVYNVNPSFIFGYSKTKFRAK